MGGESLYLQLYIFNVMHLRPFVIFALLFICRTAFSQTVVGEVPDVLPEFMPDAVCDTVIVNDGVRYEGQWPEGKGVLYDMDRGLVVGEFRGMVPEGKCTMYCIDGGRYQGYMKNGKEHGYGQYFSASGKIFSGMFENDRAHGVDTLYYPDGRVFIGVVVKGRPLDHGEKYDSVPEALMSRKPVFQECDLTDGQRKWIEENYYVAPLFKGQRQSSGTFTRWVNGKVRYPKNVSRNGRGGRVVCEFCIDVDGSVTDLKILSSPGEAFDDEVRKVMAKSPKWTPGTRGGKPVKVRYDFSVVFYQQN